MSKPHIDILTHSTSTSMNIPNDTAYTMASELEVYIHMNDDIPRFLWKALPVAYLGVGVIFNCLLIYYLIKSGRWRTPLFTLVTSLAIEDLVTCLSGIGWAAIIFPMVTFPAANFTCQLFWFTGLVGVIGSNYHLVFFAALRFYQLVFPLAARARVTCSFVLTRCMLIWTCVVVYTLPIGLLTQPEEVVISDDVVSVCGFVGNPYAREMAFLILDTIIPILAITVLHLGKYIIVSRSKVAMVTQQQDRKNTDARAVSIVIVLFIIAWLPCNIYVTIQQAHYQVYHQYQDNLFLIFLYLIAANSTANPIVYCIAAETVRKDLAAFLFSGRNKRK